MRCEILFINTKMLLLEGHAFHADIDAIKMTIESMKEKRVFVTHNVFADMIDAMSMGGHHDKIPEVERTIVAQLTIFCIHIHVHVITCCVHVHVIAPIGNALKLGSFFLFL